MEEDCGFDSRRYPFFCRRIEYQTLGAACIRSTLFTICSSEISLSLAPKLSHTRSSRRFACAAEKPNVLKARARSRNLVDDLTSESTVTFGSTPVDVASDV